MKALRNLLDKVKPNFEKGGKLHAFHSTFDALETMMFVPNTTTSRGAHIRDCNDTKRTMSVVIMALMPALLMGIYNIGYQHFAMLGQEANFWDMVCHGALAFLPSLIVSYGVGLGIEVAFAQSRGHEVQEGFLVSGLLIPMIMPIDLPLWMLAISVAFAVVLGKEVFGGTGMNVFNPALLARAFAFFAYTPQMSGEKVWVSGMTNTTTIADGFSGATALEHFATKGALGCEQLYNAFIGLIPGSVGETSTVAILIGAVILLGMGVASWRSMLSVFAGGAVMGLIFNAVGANEYMNIPFWHHFIVGGFAFGAVFMATDPVTTAQTNCGKYIVGFMTGLLAVLIRVINPAYPEGMMLAILFMNALAPLVDYYVVEANVNRRNARLKTVK